ncbi:ATP-dependent DNA helicase PIF1, partial [Linum grandiflorum]
NLAEFLFYADVHAIEFQKRGLPHAHILVFLSAEDKIYSTSHIDSIICAEIPDSVADEKCYTAVSTFMFHGPCGAQGPKASCMVDGKCTKHFPKKFNPETSFDADGFPRYKRSDNGRHITKNQGKLDNRHVVPYNRYLLLRFDAHINVEYCNKSRAVKYLFKYINKPPDRNSTMDGLLQSELAHTSMLLEWMEMNKVYPEARKYTFVEFPQYYVWNPQPKTWTRRKRGPNIGRLYYCQPSSNERFYLRMLLQIVKGCRSFDDLKTVNNVQYDSFKEACNAYGFLTDDRNQLFFIDGYGGTGKTFLWQVISVKLRSEKKVVICVATAGIAALLMTGGRTAHSRFHIPIDVHSASTCHIEQGSELAELLENTSLIIWDEAPMAHKHCIESLDRSLRDIGEEMCYYSSNSIQSDSLDPSSAEAEYPIEFLNDLQIGNFPAHELKLKVGVPVILLRNLDQTTGLCNGTRMVIRTMGTWFLEVEILTGTHIGDRVYLPRLSLTSHQKSLNFTLVRRQYPIALSFGMTINKSQGQTLQSVGLCLKRQVFTHGQLYVAVSRVTRRSGLKIISCDEASQPTQSMKNIVFREVLN